MAADDRNGHERGGAQAPDDFALFAGAAGTENRGGDEYTVTLCFVGGNRKPPKREARVLWRQVHAPSRKYSHENEYVSNPFVCTTRDECCRTLETSSTRVFNNTLVSSNSDLL